MSENDLESTTESESRGTLRIAVFIGVMIALAVLILSLIAESERESPLYVGAALQWVAQWIGLVFVLLAPIVAIWLLRTKDLAWTLLPSVAFFVAGAALLGHGSWGPYVALSAVVLGAAAIVIWRPADDAES